MSRVPGVGGPRGKTGAEQATTQSRQPGGAQPGGAQPGGSQPGGSQQEVSQPGGRVRPAWRPERAGRAGLAASGLSVAATLIVAMLGPSLLEPALPGHTSTPPWFFTAHPSPYLVVALALAAVVAGTAGLGLTIWASRRGWQVSPWLLLAAGIVAAVALALLPPFGSGDHLSYAAYGRMAATGHDPYTTTPAELARLGDPIARAVGQWRNSPSVYGALATGGQALASAAGGTSVRLTVFILSLENVLAFSLAGLLLHRLARGDRRRQLRAALLWTANPLLLQVLVAGAHVDSQAIVFVVASLAAFALAVRPTGRPSRPDDAGAGARAAAAGLIRLAAGATVAGALVGLGFAVKVTMALAGAGLALACLLAWRESRVTRGRAARSPAPAAGTAPAHGAAAGAAGSGAAAGGAREAATGAEATATGAEATATGAEATATGAEATATGAGRRAWLEPVVMLTGLAAGFALAAGASLAVWGLHSLSPAARAGSQVSIGSPWRSVRSVLRLGGGLSAAAAEDAVKFASVVLGAVLLVLLLRAVLATGRRTLADPASGGDPASGSGAAEVFAAGAASRGYRVIVAGLAVSVVAAVALAWLFAWPYVLPWYDGLGWALLALLPWSRLDGLLLARTAALAIGYLPATGAPLPAGLGWLETVVRTGVTPVVLLACVVTLIVTTWPGRNWAWPGEADWRPVVPFGKS